MPKYFLFFTLLSIICFDLKAQKIVFELNGRFNTALEGEYKSSDIREWYSSTMLNDSMVIRTFSTYTEYLTKTYVSNDGYELNGLFQISLSDRFSLKTGIGLQYGTLGILSSYQLSDGEITRVDTIAKVPSIPVEPVCDCYENSFLDVSSGFNNGIQQEALHLAMPAELQYDLIPGKLHIRTGLYFQTPLYAAFKRELIRVEMTTMGDTTKCKYVKEIEKNSSTTGVSNFQWGVSAWLSYNIVPWLEIEIGARKHMNDMYTQTEDGFASSFFFSNYPNSYKPLTFSVGLSYKFINLDLAK